MGREAHHALRFRVNVEVDSASTVQHSQPCASVWRHRGHAYALFIPRALQHLGERLFILGILLGPAAGTQSVRCIARLLPPAHSFHDGGEHRDVHVQIVTCYHGGKLLRTHSAGGCCTQALSCDSSKLWETGGVVEPNEDVFSWASAAACEMTAG